MRKNIQDTLHKLRRLWNVDVRADRVERTLDMLASKLELEPKAFFEFQSIRSTPKYGAAFVAPEPLVSVCVATYNRAELLTKRCIPSILRQTYRNLEIVVVGDACPDDTADRLAKIQDSRLRFEILPERGTYPEDPKRRWMVAGTAPVNQALMLARGAFITHLDDDDEYAPDRLERLVAFAQCERADLVYHPYWMVESKSGKRHLNRADEFQWGAVTTSTIFYHHWFRRILWDVNAHLTDEPGDWNRLRKFRYLGARALRYPEPLMTYYK